MHPPPPIRKLVFFGHFLGELTKPKRSFWIESARDHRIELCEQIYIIENGSWSKQNDPLDDLRVLAAAEVLTRGAVSWRKLVVGLTAALGLVTRSPRLLSELIMLEKVWYLGATGKFRGWSRFFRRWSQFPFRFLCGLGHLDRIWSSLGLGSGDLVILYGQNLSGQRYLRYLAKRYNVPLFISEGGDLQGSMFVSEQGMLHDSWIRTRSSTFENLPVTEPMQSAARGYFSAVSDSRYSIKSYSQSISQKTIERLRSAKIPVIYVNGAENLANGLLPRCGEASHRFSPYFATNLEILECVAEVAAKHGWQVIYKDHPNTLQYHPHLAVKKCSHEEVVILDNVNIHDVLEVASAMVTLGSKSTFLALDKGVPVVLAGPFTVAPENLDYGLVEESDLEAGIIKVLSRPEADRVDRQGLINLVARLMNYYSYSMPDAPWQSDRNQDAVWHDIKDYLAGNREVISCGSFSLPQKSQS